MSPSRDEDSCRECGGYWDAYESGRPMSEDDR